MFTTFITLCCHVRLSGEAVRCFQCKDRADSLTCTHVTSCADGEVRTFHFLEFVLPLTAYLPYFFCLVWLGRVLRHLITRLTQYFFYLYRYLDYFCEYIGQLWNMITYDMLEYFLKVVPLSSPLLYVCLTCIFNELTHD